MSKKGRTLKQQLITNYGEQIGLQKLLEYKAKRKYQLSQQYYIDKYGNQIGKIKYQEFREKTKFLIQPEKCARTLQFFIQKYGNQLGKLKWNHYREMQAKTNTFEYKQEKYGWTKEQFQQYNKSRAITLPNLIAKYGKELGTKKYENYCEKQRYTKSKEYLITKFGQKLGLQKFQKINKAKARTKENFIKKYGPEIGLIKWKAYCNIYKRTQ